MSYYLGYIPTCPSGSLVPNSSFQSLGPHSRSRSDRQSDGHHTITCRIPECPESEYRQESGGQQLFSFATYNRANKLPYTINDTLDIQWQPRNDLAIEIGYVGNLGRHGVIPIPFNQPGIASPSNIIHPEFAVPAGIHLRLHGADSSGLYSP